VAVDRTLALLRCQPCADLRVVACGEPKVAFSKEACEGVIAMPAGIDTGRPPAAASATCWHIWPDLLDAAAQCQGCGLNYEEWST
jgi:hypothetical protein